MDHHIHSLFIKLIVYKPWQRRSACRAHDIVDSADKREWLEWWWKWWRSTSEHRARQ